MVSLTQLTTAWSGRLEAASLSLTAKDIRAYMTGPKPPLLMSVG
jgi:hypothetical protein